MRLLSTALLLATLAVSAPARAQAPIVLQAEDAVLTDRDTSPGNTDGPAVVRTSDSSVTGATGPFVAMQGGVLSLDISSVPAGQYALSALYASPFGTKYEKVTVDGVTVADTPGQCGGGFAFPTQTAFTPITLANAGATTVNVTGATGRLVITTCYGYTYFDAFTFTPVTPPPPGTASYTLQAESGVLGTTTTPAEAAEVRTGGPLGASATGPYVALRKGTITLNTSSIPPGQYLLSTFAASPDGVKYEKLTVDGTSYGNSTQCGTSFEFLQQAAFANVPLADTATRYVTVTGATGTLVLTACYGFTYYDSFTFTPVATVAQSVYDGLGWRLLSAPVQDVTVGTLARLNLVQGIPDQYPAAGANLYTGYAGTYAAPASEAVPVEPGRGFFWRLYDQNIPATTAFGGGTSRSYELSAFQLSATGPVLTASVQRAFPLNAVDGFYMIGNPFARAFQPSGVTLAAGGGTLSTNLQAFDPNGNTYRIVSGAMSPWQGVFAEVAGGTAPTFAFDYAATTAGSAVLVGKTGVAGSRLELALTGEVGGAAVTDRALVIRLEDDATTGWDRHDGSKLALPEASALVSIRGDRLGTMALKAVESLPTALSTETTLALAFATPAAGTFTLSAPDGSGFPEGWRVEARDMVTGARADLTAGQALPFTSDATAWTDRFVLVVTAGRPVAAGDTPAGTFEVGTVSPNPTAGAARISVQTAAAQDVTVRVYDVLGREVARVHDGPLAAGTSQVDIDTAALAPGAYVVRVSGAEATVTRRFTVVR